MKEIYVEELTPGMKVARDVYNPYNYHMILQKGAQLTDVLIARMRLHGVISVCIEEDEVESEANLSYSERLRKDEDFIKFKKAYESLVEDFRGKMSAVVEQGSALDLEYLLDNTLKMVAMGSAGSGVLDMVMHMREYDDTTFAHSINVALLCNLLADWNKLDRAQIEMATMCGLLHDMGKMQVQPEILNKPEKLTVGEFIQVKKHTVSGYDLLKVQDVDVHIKNAALMHHERVDGSGYPLQLKGGQIDLFAKIVAIADVFDAMTSPRSYRGPFCPFQVIENFEKEGFEKYDVEFLLPFLEHIADTFIRNRCKLSDGQEGEIVYINKGKISKPIIETELGYLNLSENQDISIVEIL